MAGGIAADIVWGSPSTVTVDSQLLSQMTEASLCAVQANGTEGAAGVHGAGGASPLDAGGNAGHDGTDGTSTAAVAALQVP